MRHAASLRLVSAFLLPLLLSPQGAAQSDQRGPGLLALFSFDGNTKDSVRAATRAASDEASSFTRGVRGQALKVSAGLDCGRNGLPLDDTRSFSVQCWVRTTADSARRFVLVSKKSFPDNSLHSQKLPGWVFYFSYGTWAWNMGSGARRITNERDNGQFMRLNDGRWHQLTMTHDADRSEVRLYFDGINRAIYNIGDTDGFKFANSLPLTVGAGAQAGGRRTGPAPPTIEDGADNLQKLVDAFNGLGVDPVLPEELVDLIVDPRRFLNRKVQKKAERLGAEGAAFAKSMKVADLTQVRQAESALMRSPYTVHQNRNFTTIAPVAKLYALVGGRVTVRESGARELAARERMGPPAFDIDDLAVWDRVLSQDEVLGSFARQFVPVIPKPKHRIAKVTVAAWNIWHGGKHFTVVKDGWDSRVTIAEMIKREGVDLVMMQETYSSGDFIAAELGYYFATTVDWDYLNQGANISVLSRYPIKEVRVPKGAAFNNVAVKVVTSKTQDLWVMSNWYGMQQFPEVFKFHEGRFGESDVTPILFAGDFNAVSHEDGGKSPASEELLAAGFIDAFRSRHSDVQRHPGASHRSGRRIDQLYYKGKALTNTSTSTISTWPTAFPSDHYMIVASFDFSGGTARSKR